MKRYISPVAEVLVLFPQSIIMESPAGDILGLPANAGDLLGGGGTGGLEP